MASSGRIYHAAPSTTSPIGWNGREYRESTRSTERRVAERLLASRVADGRGRGHHGTLTFDHLGAWYLDDYLVRRLRTVDTARGRVANLRATFGGQPATVMTTEAIRSYQRTRLAAGAAAATVNRETSARSRMLRALDHRPVYPERLEERGSRQGFFEHADYEAVRRHLPLAYQDVLDFAYYSGWRKREILELRWSEVDEGRWRRAPVAGTVQNAGWAGAADCAAGIVKLRLTAVFDAQHGGFATSSKPSILGVDRRAFRQLDNTGGQVECPQPLPV